ncbi:MAG: aspartate aminotransferase family protein [Desulfosarcina sp.]|nr:aspartate aminotransferase family protein [Desulfobacterales bacterium]
MAHTVFSNLEVLKQQAIEDFRNHVSFGKVRFWQQFDMDLVMGRREGSYFWDLDGRKRYFNLHCNGGVYNLGHRHPEIVKALKRALDEVDIGNGHLISLARAQLGRRLAELMPGDLNYTVFGVSGGEAVDLAIKVARAYTGRTGIVSVFGGYHGHTGLALAAGDDQYRAPFGPPCPGFQQVPFNDLKALEAVLNDDTAAVILETIPATLGMPTPHPGYYPGIRRLCDGRGVLLILDEVQTGFGRTGRLWGFEHFGIVPDMVILGKGMSGGIYPITATVLRTPLEAVFHPEPHIHVSTGGGSELGCYVALKVLEISSRPEFLGHVNQLADKFRIGVGRLIEKHGILNSLRQRGLFMGLKLEDDLCGPILCKTAFDNGLFMVYANNDKSVTQFLPPLIMSPNEADDVLIHLDQALTQARAFKDMLAAQGGPA